MERKKSYTNLFLLIKNYNIYPCVTSQSNTETGKLKGEKEKHEIQSKWAIKNLHFYLKKFMFLPEILF